MLKDLRTNQQEPSFSFQSSRKKEPVFGGRSDDTSPIASPWKRYGTHDGHSAPPLSSIRNPRRESTGSALDPFDRFLANTNNHHDDDNIEEGDEEVSSEQERSAFQFSRDDSQMSVDSPFDQRK